MTKPMTSLLSWSVLSPSLLRLSLLCLSLFAFAGCADEPSTNEPSAGPAVVRPPKGALPAVTHDDLRALLASYERARVALAKDALAGLSDEGSRMAQHLTSAAAALPPQDSAVPWLRASAERMRALAVAPSLDDARARFQEASAVVVALLHTHPSLREGLHVFECPMVEGFNKWVQPTPDLANPYMGTRMLACGAETGWEVDLAFVSAPVVEPSRTEGSDAHGHSHGDVAHYTCPMHPSVKQSGPGQCPLCGMDLVPVSSAELESGVVRFDELRRQKLGVRTAPVVKAPLAGEIRTVGRVTFDETRLYDVNLKLSGWVERLHVDETGAPVKRGQLLFTLYSPDLYAAQVELISAQRAVEAAGKGISQSLVASAAKKLRLWDVSDAQIEKLKSDKQALRAMPIYSPASGHVVEKSVVHGSSVAVGQTVYRIADLSRVWVEAEVYEADLARVRKGQKARVTLSYLPGRSFAGEVTFVSPVLDASTRTGRVRLELPNDDLTLKPNMYAEVTLLGDGADALQIPREAVLYTGRRRLVFVDLGGGRVKPQEVTVGRESGSRVEVLSGLEAGDVVVTSGNFLLAAESRLKNATGFWHDDETVAPLPSSDGHGHGGHSADGSHP